MRTIKQMKKQAKESYKEHQDSSIVAAICIYSLMLISYSSDNLIFLFRRHEHLITAVSSTVIFILVAAFIVGLARYTLEIINSNKSDIATFFSSFENIFNVLLLHLLKTIFIFLWSLLLVIPGIIAAYRYRMSEFIMAENPEISPLEAIRLSKKMMIGKKVKLFDLDLSFIGWFILSAVTFGIAGLYFLPYFRLTTANFFIDVRKEYMDELDFRAEWNARKGESGLSSQNDDFDSRSETNNQEVWKNSACEHENDNNGTDDKTYI